MGGQWTALCVADSFLEVLECRVANEDGRNTWLRKPEAQRKLDGPLQTEGTRQLAKPLRALEIGGIRAAASQLAARVPSIRIARGRGGKRTSSEHANHDHASSGKRGSVDQAFKVLLAASV